MKQDPAFWRGRRVLVTGHTGFKGAWLSLWLRLLGAEVAGLSLPAPTSPSLFELARVGGDVRTVTGDIRELGVVRAAVAEHRPEVVFHLAAQALVRRSYEAPVETFATNVLGTVHVLEAARLAGGVRAVVVVTSDKCYENREWPWGYRESEAMGGHDPYSGSKGAAELATASYRRSFFAPERHAQHGCAVASARAGNVIGGGDWAEDRLVPDVVRAILAGKPVPVRNPHAVRPWQHVLEPLAGYLELARRLVLEGPAFAEAWNFGPWEDDARPVSWVVERLTALWGDGARWERDAGDHPHEASYLKLDAAKARARLGWRPVWGLEAALRRVVEWTRVYRDGGDVRAATIAHIEAYAAEASR